MITCFHPSSNDVDLEELFDGGNPSIIEAVGPEDDDDADEA